MTTFKQSKPQLKKKLNNESEKISTKKMREKLYGNDHFYLEFGSKKLMMEIEESFKDIKYSIKKFLFNMELAHQANIISDGTLVDTQKKVMEIKSLYNEIQLIFSSRKL